MVMAARDSGLVKVIVPVDNVPEASLVTGVEIFGFSTLCEVVEYLEGRREYGEQSFPVNREILLPYSVDFADVQGPLT